MAAINAAHWTVDRETGNIRYTGDDHDGASPSYAEVIELHRWLQGLADDPVSTGNDELDITDVLPSSRATDNLITLLGNYNIDDDAAEHLFDGSIVQGTGGTEVYYDGIVNFGNQGVMIQLHQNGAVLADDWWNFGVGGADDTSAGAAFMTDSGESWTTDEWVGYVIKNTTDGSQALITGNTSNTITGVLFGGTANTWTSGDAYLISQGLNPDSTQGISHRFLVKTRTGGADTDSRKLLGINRTYGKTYGSFNINGTARGNNVLALSDSNDLNNTTARATVDALSDAYIDRTDSAQNASGTNAAGQAVLNVEAAGGGSFTAGDIIMTDADNQEYQIASIATDALTLTRNLVNAVSASESVYILNVGFTQIDVDNDTTDEDYYAQWDRGANSINTFYEYTKNLSADATNHYIYGIPGELFRGITHQFTIDGPTGTFASVEDVSWTAGSGGTAGTGQMLAIDSPTAGTAMWVQLLTGGTPGDNAVITGGISTATANHTAAAVIDRSSLLTNPFLGASTGTALVGSYGTTLQKLDLSSSDLVFDLTNAPITPPNTVTFSVNGPAIASEDYVLVGPWDGTSTDINGNPSFYTEYTLDTALSADNITTVTVNETIDTWLDADGYIQVWDDNDVVRRLHYSSFSGNDFTIDTTNGEEDFNAVNASSGVRVTYSQMQLGTALTTDNVTTFVMENNIPTDTPSSGTIRLQDDSGRLRKISYDSFTGATFSSTESSGEEDFSGDEAAVGSNVWISYIDRAATVDPEEFQYVYSGSDRKHVVLVRDGGGSPIKESIGTGTMGTNGGSAAVTRTSDA